MWEITKLEEDEKMMLQASRTSIISFPRVADVTIGPTDVLSRPLTIRGHGQAYPEVGYALYRIAGAHAQSRSSADIKEPDMLPRDRKLSAPDIDHRSI